MPKATDTSTTPGATPLGERYVRATSKATVTLHQPLPRKQRRVIIGRLLGEMHARGALHHYRVQDANGVVYLAPPTWLALESRLDVVQAGLTVLGEMPRVDFTEAIKALAKQFADARAARHSEDVA